MRDAYKSASGKYIGNTTYEQLELMHSYLYSISSVRQATVGDLVFHQNGSNHVGIYLGNGKVLHASQTAGKVKISTFSSSSRYWDTGCNACGVCGIFCISLHELNFLILHIRFYKLASYLQPKTALKEESPYICGR